MNESLRANRAGFSNRRAFNGTRYAQPAPARRQGKTFAEQEIGENGMKGWTGYWDLREIGCPSGSSNHDA
ncbi:MAG: hypothetical protein WA980_11565 [Shinella zoogloeoides]|uniref:hypothetical protein n=1 Tax=Shinella zoogloeoides TaxID=352475 RepID=UPI003C73D340